MHLCRFILLLITLFFSNSLLQAQIITTYGGGGMSPTDGVLATFALISNPAGGIFDAMGNYYFGQQFTNPKIRKINGSGIISTVAGNGTSGFSGDNGPATAAKISFPLATVDSLGNIYISDRDNRRVRKVDASTGIIKTIAGNGIGGFSGDGGPATIATLYPHGICIDKDGSIFVIDSATRIRKINTAGIITTVAGNGNFGHSGDGNAATSAEINAIYGICTDAFGNLFIGCYGWIRKVNLATGIITTVAGNGNYTFNGDGIPALTAQFNAFQIAVDIYGNIYISDYLNQRIRKIDVSGIINTVTGTGIPGYFGDGGMASAAQIYNPEGIALDSCENIYIADKANNRIRKVTYPHCHFLSINEQPIQLVISIHPNPTSTDLIVENVQPNTTYQLCNALGSVMQAGNLKQGNNTISVAPLPPGMYMLLLTDEDGRRTMHKIIKE